MSTENYYSQFMMLPEYCLHHPMMNVEIYCACNTKLCLSCLRDHYHENLSFHPIKETVSKFHTEVNSVLSGLNNHLEKLKSNKKENTQSLIISLSQISGRIRSIISTRYFIPYDVLIDFKKENFNEKASDLILNYYKKQSVGNKHLLEEMMKRRFDRVNLSADKKKEKIVKNKKIETKSEMEIFSEKINKLKIEVRENSLTLSNIKNQDHKLITNTIFQSNKENIDPLQNLQNFPKLCITNRTELKTELLTEVVSNFISTSNQVTPPKSRAEVFKLNLSKIPSFKPKKGKIYSIYFKPEPIKINLKYETQNQFLDSNSSKKSKSDLVKIVCITCRDKFIVMKEQTGWRVRCDVCTENFN